MTSKQRAYLRSLAVNQDTILYVGKSGLGAQVFKEAGDALKKRELIKGRVLPETCPSTPREAVVQVIGSRFVLYKPDPKEPRIKLPK